MIYITSDHRGFQLKKHLLTYIKTQLKKPITDLGPKTYDKEDDFVDFAIKLGKTVAKKKSDVGISICGSGHGMCITTNKIKGIRAIIGYSIEGAELGKRDNDANVLCLSGNILSNDHADSIVKKFLETNFDGLERRVRRLKKIAELEK